MPHEDKWRQRTRVARYLSEHPPKAWQGALALALTVLTLALGAGFLFRLFDPDAVGTRNEALYWAITTLTTVGYGDITPTDNAGRSVAMLVMLLGTSFIAIVTAVVTTVLLERAQAERERRRESPIVAEIAALRETVERLEQRVSSTRSRE